MGGRGFKFSLLFGIVTCFLSGTGLTAQNSPRTYVKGLLGRSALLPIDISPRKTVIKIKLDFGSQKNKMNEIAVISNGTLNCTNACGRFGQRLKMVNETALRINDLEMEDSGFYNVHVRFNDYVSPKYPFYLTVYAPVPQPQITLLNVSEAPGGFNVTLKCLVPEEEKIDISWGRGDPISPLEGCSDWHCLSGNGTILQLFWKPGSSNSTITCQASNAVDQKNASYDLNSIAPVPMPQITRLNVSEAPGGFNVTLQCLASRREKIAISWGRGDPISPLEECSDWHCLSGNGTILQLFWKPGSSNSTITCQASNAVDQKNASYDLNSIAPVPMPQITRLNVSEAPGGFNVTLQCLASRREKIAISWGRGDPISPLEECSDWHCLSGNGTILQLFWKPGSSNSTITCQASNAVDQKNASYDLNSIGANLPPYAIAIICVVAILFIIVVGLIWWKRESKFRKVFCHRNSTPNGTELQEVKTLPSVSLQNGYSKCALSEPDNISDSIHPPGPLENC